MDIALAVMTVCAVIFAVFSGSGSGLSESIMSGAAQAVETVIKMAGGICFWSGLLEVMSRSGLSGKMARLFNPVISMIYGRNIAPETRESLAENMSANLLGLGNAATPAGLKAGKGLMAEAPEKTAVLIVMNSVSFQLIPTTVAVMRSGMGWSTPYDIIVRVWMTGICAVFIALALSKICLKK